MIMVEKSEKHIKEKEDILSEAFSVALNTALSAINCDLRCIDWLSYNPDFFIDKQNTEAA